MLIFWWRVKVTLNRLTYKGAFSLLGSSCKKTGAVTKPSITYLIQR